MSALGDEISAALSELEADIGETILYRGLTLPCIPNGANRGMTVVIGAKEVTVAFTINIRKNLFFSVDSTMVSVDATVSPYFADYDLRRPVSGLVFNYRGRDYKIANVTDDPTGTFYGLVMVDPNSSR